jgi:hypothetical protein
MGGGTTSLLYPNDINMLAWVVVPPPYTEIRNYNNINMLAKDYTRWGIIGLSGLYMVSERFIYWLLFWRTLSA